MNILPKSEKWMPVIIIVWGCTLITLAFRAAWIDPVRYLEMIAAIGESVQIVIGVLIAATAYYADARMKYKGKLAELNPNFKETFTKEVAGKPAEVKENV